MANDQNLKGHGFNEITANRQREIASQGGKASAEARKRRKSLKEELLAILSDGDVQERISLALVKEATEGNNAGSVTKAYEVIRDTIGEKPVDKVMISEVDASVISEIENIVLGENANADKGTST